MPRPTWKGQIAFGLVNVPVMLYPAEQRSDLSFHLVDSRDSGRVRYQRVNEETGEEVPWEKVAKAYEYKSGNYVVLTDEELESAAVEMTRTIEIEQFVDLDDIDPLYFDKPYYLVPDKSGEKGYVLLRKALEHANKAGIARVVIRTRQYLAAVVARHNALMLDLLRYTHELRTSKDFDLPGQDLRKYKITQKEVALAGQLLNGMSAEWKPESFKDEYHDALLKVIDAKVRTGDVHEAVADTEQQRHPTTLNFMDALKKSLKQPAPKADAKRTVARRHPRKKKRAG
jgi:DNA end-binding protein Ku